METFKKKCRYANKMHLPQKTQDLILKAIMELGPEGAIIAEIERKVNYERHTVSKFLSVMESQGLLYHKEIGKAKLWFVSRMPLQNALSAEKKSYIENVLSNLLSALPLGMAVVDKEYTLLFLNKKMSDTYGNQVGKKFYEVVLDAPNPLGLQKITRVITEQAEQSEMVVRDKADRILNITASRVMNPDQNFSIVLMIEDITRRKLAEDMVLEQKTLLEAEREALNRSAIVAETDLRGVMTFVNDKFVEISGYRREELLGKTHKVINSGHHPKKFFGEMWATISKGKVWTGIIKNRAKNGKFYWVDSVITPVMKNGKPIKYLAIRFDITRYMKK